MCRLSELYLNLDRIETLELLVARVFRTFSLSALNGLAVVIEVRHLIDGTQEFLMAQQKSLINNFW